MYDKLNILQNVQDDVQCIITTLLLAEFDIFVIWEYFNNFIIILSQYTNFHNFFFFEMTFLDVGIGLLWTYMSIRCDTITYR